MQVYVWSVCHLQVGYIYELIGNDPFLSVRVVCSVRTLGPCRYVPSALVAMAAQQQLSTALWTRLQSTKHHPISTAVQQLQGRNTVSD